MNVLTSPLGFAQINANTIIEQVDNIRHQSRALYINNPYVKRLVNLYLNNVLGSEGFKFQNKARQPSGELDTIANARIEEGFRGWIHSPVDAAQTVDLHTFHKQLMISFITDGEYLIYKVPNSPDALIQHIDVDAIDTQLNGRNSENSIVGGIEIDPMGKPLYYYLLTKNRMDPRIVIFPGDKARLRVDARNLIHGFKKEFVGQLRGISMLHTPSESLDKLKQFSQATLNAAKLGADLSGFLKRVGDSGQLPEDDFIDTVTDTAVKQKIEAGTFKSLPVNVEPEMFDSGHPNPAMPAFNKDHLREIAAAWGVSYFLLANDLSAVNYSSGKIGGLEDREFWLMEQRFWINTFLNRVYKRWLSIKLPSMGLPRGKFDKFNAPVFMGRRWQWAEPSKEISAIEKAINLGITTVSRELIKMGIDPDDHFEELERDIARYASMGLAYPIGTAITINRINEEQNNEND